MRIERRAIYWLATVVSAAFLTTVAAAASPGDLNDNGYVDTVDLALFLNCVAGPGTPPITGCAPADLDFDNDVDAVDFALLQRLAGHNNIPLKDTQGNPVLAVSATPYSPRQTCGQCHDVNSISNAYHYQQGRTDAAGNVIMHDDYFGDGRFFVRSAGMYGKW